MGTRPGWPGSQKDEAVTTASVDDDSCGKNCVRQGHATAKFNVGDEVTSL